MNAGPPRRPMDVILVDPSLFTPAYDAGLSEGLSAAGVRPRWAVRPLRPGEQAELRPAECDPFFYRAIEGTKQRRGRLRSLAKGASHLSGLLALLRRVRGLRPAAVHMQWTVLPALDALVMRMIRRTCPVVMTVHDTVPFNGEKISFLQNAGFDLPMRAADRVVVHTRGARENLLARGIADKKIALIPHGPLPLRAVPRPRPLRDPRFTFVLFGQIKPYKGLDLLVEAFGRLPEEVRRQARTVAAGAPLMDTGPVQSRIAELDLSASVELRLGRLDDQAMADLFDEADAFVFPYRQIDASGVYFLLKPLGKWMIASRVGIFAEDMRDGEDGALVPPGDVAALAGALRNAVDRRPPTRPVDSSGGWQAIGERTRQLYLDAIEEHGRRSA